MDSSSKIGKHDYKQKHITKGRKKRCSVCFPAVWSGRIDALVLHPQQL
jgi:hypothetical protein